MRMWLAIVAVVLVALAARAEEARDPQVRRHVPADGRIAIADHGYRDWGPELVHYGVDTKRFPPGRLALLDGEGRAVPFQIDGGVLAFVASVPKGGTAVYTLQASERDRSTANSTLAWGEFGDVVEMRNEHLALRMPKPGSAVHAKPVAASAVPPPIVRWAGRDGRWMGGARFVTARKVAAHAFAVVRQGPACAEYEARYRFAPKGEYVWRVRLSPGMPIAIVTEEFDFGEVTEGRDLLMLDLHAGWTPQHTGWVTGAGEERMPPFRRAAFADHVASKRKAAAEAAPVGGVGKAPRSWEPEKSLVLLSRTAPAGKWGGYVGGIGVWDGAEPGEGRTMALMPLSAGSWRRTMVLNAWHKDGAGIAVGLPLSVRHTRWSLDIADDFSPFSTHEHDEGLPRTYGRRVWGLYVGRQPAEAQAQFGYIGLDRYKDWTLDWPDTVGAKAYPGGFFSPAHVERLRKALGRHPDRDYLKTWYLFSGKAEDAVRHAERVIKQLKKPYGENNFHRVGLSGYRKSQFFVFANLAEDALACPELPADLRRELRLRVALYAHVFSDPDLNPRGSGVHLGNNNMTINRTLALTYFAGLLPDHPRYRYWMDRARAYAEFKLATQTAQCGTWVACPTYQLYSPTRTLNITQNILRNRGIADLGDTPHLANTLRYLANLTMPDPRFDGHRILPGMGNSGNQVENVWGFAMAAVADRDPKLAGWLRFVNRLANGDMPLEPGPNSHDKRTPHPLYYLPDVPESPEPLTTAFFPAYGVMFRAHFDTPGETAMLFRAGMNWSHWDTDALNLVLYAKGAPLSPGTGYQYYSGPATQGNAIYHNRVKVGRRDLQEVFGRVDAAVADYGFGPSADYAVADRYYPPELFKDGKGEMRWRRHVLFLTSPEPEGTSYFVLRDTFPFGSAQGRPGGESRRKWWTWLNLGTAGRIAVDGKAFDNAGAPLNKVVAEGEMPKLRGQSVEMRTAFGVSTWLWMPEPRDVRIRMTFDYPAQPSKETKTLVEIPAGPGQGFHHVIWPRKDGTATPKCAALGKGVLAVTTEESTDTIFVGDAPFAWSRDGVEFTGKAGAVRVFRDRVALCLNSGSGRVGYKGHVVEGHGPFERVVRLDALKPGVDRAEGGYAKKAIRVDLGRGVAVTGEGPFEARLDGETVRIRTRGRDRVLHVTQPPFIIRPQYWIDGRESMACWTDYPASGWGTYEHSWLIGLSVPEGVHELAVRDMRFPRGWTRPFAPSIPGEAPE